MYQIRVQFYLYLYKSNPRRITDDRIVSHDRSIRIASEFESEFTLLLPGSCSGA